MLGNYLKISNTNSFMLKTLIIIGKMKWIIRKLAHRPHMTWAHNTRQAADVYTQSTMFRLLSELPVMCVRPNNPVAITTTL
jgi:hypothetical protein